MVRAPTSAHNPRRTAKAVRERIESGGERLWRYSDFEGLPFQSVAQALSRLVKAGVIERLSKGTYYRSRATALGPSRPNVTAIQELATHDRRVFPAGTGAAGVLGFTTQTPARVELATSASNLPRKLVGCDTIVHARRPQAWSGLSDADAAILDLLRERGASSELSPAATVNRMLDLLKAPGRFARLAAVADTEPPRVRALLGALGEELGKSSRSLALLRTSLNPLSRFDFGVFSGLKHAESWQAKRRT